MSKAQLRLTVAVRVAPPSVRVTVIVTPLDPFFVAEAPTAPLVAFMAMVKLPLVGVPLPVAAHESWVGASVANTVALPAWLTNVAESTVRTALFPALPAEHEYELVPTPEHVGVTAVPFTLKPDKASPVTPPFTTRWVRVPVEAWKVPAPEYSAVSECGAPKVAKLVWQVAEPLIIDCPEQSVVLPSLNVTVPVGVPVPDAGATVAVKMTFELLLTGF